MNDLRKAAEMALETAENIANAKWQKWQELAMPEEFERWAKSRATYMAQVLRQALAEPEQEPVPEHGKQLHDQLITAIHQLLNAKDEPSSWGQVGPDAFDIAWHQVTALVSHICTAIDSPDIPPKRGWVGLTDEEIYDYADKFLYQHGSNYGIKSFGKAIENKLKDKNGG